MVFLKPEMCECCNLFTEMCNNKREKGGNFIPEASHAGRNTRMLKQKINKDIKQNWKSIKENKSST
jgi:hypothetical protein